MVVPARSQHSLVRMVVTTLVLALLPGCFTQDLWQRGELFGDDGGLSKSETRARIDGALPLPARLVLPLTDAQRQQLAAILPLVDETSRALVVTFPGPIAWADLHAGQLPGEAACVALRIAVDVDGAMRAAVRLAGEQGEQPCDVEAVAVLPEGAGAGPPFPVPLEVVRFDGRSTTAKVLWTPVTFAADVVLLPFVAIAFVLMMAIGGRHPTITALP